MAWYGIIHTSSFTHTCTAHTHIHTQNKQTIFCMNFFHIYSVSKCLRDKIWFSFHNFSSTCVLYIRCCWGHCIWVMITFREFRRYIVCHNCHIIPSDVSRRDTCMYHTRYDDDMVGQQKRKISECCVLYCVHRMWWENWFDNWIVSLDFAYICNTII